MEPFIGQIIMFGGNFAPRGWALCHGQLLAIAQNTALFSIVGTTYGGDGRTTFGLPDLRGRAPVGQGAGPGLSSYRLGQKGGQETVTLNATEMPGHTHGVSAAAKALKSRGNSGQPIGNLLARDGNNVSQSYYSGLASRAGNMNESAIEITEQEAGGNAAHDNVSPYLAVNHIIALTGVFPSRS